MVGGMKSYFESNSIPTRDLGGLKQNLYSPGSRDPTETEPDLLLSVSCEGTGQQWPALGIRALAVADLGHTACGISHFRGCCH